MVTRTCLLVAWLINTGHIHVNAPAILPHGKKNPRWPQTSSLAKSESEAGVPLALFQPAGLSYAQRKGTANYTCAFGTGLCRLGTATCTCAVETGLCRLGTFTSKKIPALMQASLYLYVSLPLFDSKFLCRFFASRIRAEVEVKTN